MAAIAEVARGKRDSTYPASYVSNCFSSDGILIGKYLGVSRIYTFDSEIQAYRYSLWLNVWISTAIFLAYDTAREPIEVVEIVVRLFLFLIQGDNNFTIASHRRKGSGRWVVNPNICQT